MVPAPAAGVHRAATVSRVQLTVVDHPLARARLTRMRDERTDNAAFRAALAELTQMLVYEATRDLPVAEEQITTPVTATTGYRVAAPPLIVPVLRAGLGMADTAHGMLPESQMGFVGLARNEVTFQPEAYMASLPESLVDREVFVLDPMLATGGSLVHCCGLLTARGATSITVLCALAAPEGLRRLEESGLPLRVFTASVDEGLNDKAYIVPGLGDAGDRQFGAVWPCASGCSAPATGHGRSTRPPWPGTRPPSSSASGAATRSRPRRSVRTSTSPASRTWPRCSTGSTPWRSPSRRRCRWGSPSRPRPPGSTCCWRSRSGSRSTRPTGWSPRCAPRAWPRSFSSPSASRPGRRPGSARPPAPAWRGAPARG